MSSPPSARMAPGQFRVDLSAEIANTYRIDDLNKADFVIGAEEKEKA